MQIIASVARSVPFQRFEAAVRALVPQWVDDLTAPPLLLAVSGGPDSLALLALASACFSGRVAAMTIDHKLRNEAAAEAHFVATICAAIGVPHCIAVPTEPITGNLQSQARTVRYALLQAESDRLGGAYILTAHHFGDQLETILMRLARGSGVAGLSGVRPINGNIIRPLLDFQKDELRAICDDAGWSPVEDPSNADERFDRVAMRTALAKTSLPIPTRALSRSTKSLRDTDVALHWVVDSIATDRVIRDETNGIVLAVHDLPDELKRRLLLRALSEMGERPPRGEQVETVIDALNNNKVVSLGNLRIHASAQDAPKWHLSPAPPRTVR